MAKFEIIIDEDVRHQHKVVVEASSEDEVSEVLDYADNCREDTANNYICRIGKKLNVLEVDNDYSVEPKEVACNNFNEIKEEEI